MRVMSLAAFEETLRCSEKRVVVDESAVRDGLQLEFG